MGEPVNTVVRPKRWMSWTKVGVAAVGAAAVAVAVVMGTTGGDVPVGPSDSASPPVVVESPLVKLASAVKAAGTLPGEASLIINTKLLPDGPQLYYTVYTDKGQVFTGDSAQNLAATVAKGAAEPASQFNAKVTAAARLAANGDVEKAKFDMITAAGNPLGIGLSPTEADKAWAEAMASVEEKYRKAGQKVPDRPTGQDLENRINNHLFSNATHALYIAASDAEVRAGVLKLLATMKDVAIGKTVVDGQAALTLTAAAAIQGGNSTYVLTVNADNGLPIRSEGIPVKGSAEPSKPWAVNYQTARVTLADVAAGKF
ncbi:hypothetical protein ACWEIJ_44985 [Lentzea sp. NPDC004789]